MPIGKAMKNAEETIKSVGIPPQPEVILKIKKEIDSGNPNLLRIADLVSQDVGLSATTLKVASSPLIGLGKISSVSQALNLLGTKNFYNLILTSALRDTLALKGIDQKVFENFWRHSLQTAKACSFVMKVVNKKLIDDAYLIGLFHDCSVPIMMKRFKDYLQVIEYAIGPSTDAINVEEKLVNTNHCIVGYVLAKSWQLPQEIYECIMWHHSADLKYLKNDKVKLFVNCLMIAEKILHEEISSTYKAVKAFKTINTYKTNLPPTQDDTLDKEQILTTLDMEKLKSALEISDEQIEDIREDIRDIVGM
ncbi:MAG: HDOD domain-containing protein [Thermodesulfovibrionales bacterium]|nr:HDOD domain-containing protein [Thermodesulfovibrionales bacterium]